jgi:hypothetical protein
MSESVTLLVDSLYAEATEALKSRAALSASTHDLISIRGDINSEARLMRTYLVLLAKYHYNDKVQQDVMGWASSMNGNQRECTLFCSESHF